MQYKSAAKVSFSSLVVLGLSILAIHYWMETKSYLLDDQTLARISEKYVGLPHQEAFEKVHAELMDRYPGHILPPEKSQWMFVNAGGWKGAMCMIHASITEYIIFFGTAVDTVGHSGRYWANISDTVMTGTFRQWSEGTTVSQVFHPGDTILHVWGDVTMVQWSEGTWMVEYGRGFLPSTLPFTFSDTIFSTQDLWGLIKILRVYIRLLFQELACYMGELVD
ncbi:sigma non-opioid intracellular receptor 1-like [Patiria miniata]|uniref:Sigma non-opioid intracellular receptor 1 n=1 Tax=Patiria miniata TaxID=46514 RepID=A0A914BTW7_PATMI|nr:sigma non-opioid intracellular receptor 1-like [Patiria miniata]